MRSSARWAPFGAATTYVAAGKSFCCEIVTAGWPSSYSVTFVRGESRPMMKAKMSVSAAAMIARTGAPSAKRNSTAATPATITIPDTSAAITPITPAKLR